MPGWRLAPRSSPLVTFTTVVRIVLALQVGLALFAGFAYWVGLELFSDGDAEARKVSAFAWGFAVLLAMAAWRLPQDGRWILPVLATVVANLLESVYELTAQGNRDFVPPLAIELGLAIVYGSYAWRARAWRAGGRGAQAAAASQAAAR